MKHELHCLASVITSIPLSTIEWELNLLVMGV